MACQRCLNRAAEAREYIIQKPTGDARRVFCERCAEITAETYPVRSAGRQPSRTQTGDEAPPAAKSTSRGKQEEE